MGTGEGIDGWHAGALDPKVVAAEAELARFRRLQARLAERFPLEVDQVEAWERVLYAHTYMGEALVEAVEMELTATKS